MSYFDLLEIPLSFFPDSQRLRQNFYRLSREYHPDLQGNTNPLEEQEMLKKSSLLNEAYRTLSVFDRIVPYVLELKGLMTEGDKPSLPPDFLMEMMDLNEALMEAKMDDDPNGMAACKKEIEYREENLMQTWTGLCSRFDESNDASLLPLIRDCFFQYRYMLRLKEQLGEN